MARDTNRRNAGAGRQLAGREAQGPQGPRGRNSASGGYHALQGCRVGTRVPVAPPRASRGKDGACAEDAARQANEEAARQQADRPPRTMLWDAPDDDSVGSNGVGKQV